jgi:hypothetical protein
MKPFPFYQNAMNMFARAFLFVALVIIANLYFNTDFFQAVARIAALAH